MTGLWNRILERLTVDGKVALISVVSARGSVPREAGARMIVRADGAYSGSIGGGALEFVALGEAQAALADPAFRADFRDWPLGPDLGQCCGGHVTTVLEVFTQRDRAMVATFAEAEGQGGFACQSVLDGSGHLLRKRQPDVPREAAISRSGDGVSEAFVDTRTCLLLFGAGHVGRALVMALAPLPFRIRWIDSRADGFPALVPESVTPVCNPAPETEIATAPAGAFVVIMTHSHPLDLAIVTAALRRSDLASIGLIGSATKRARFEKRMGEMGLGSSDFQRLVCPIGVLGITGKEPAVIAAAVTAELLQRREGLQMARESGSVLSSRMPRHNLTGRA